MQYNKSWEKFKEFDEILKKCPVCKSRNIDKNSFVSNKSLMSISGFNHSECFNCGSFFVNPQPTDKCLQDFYSSQETENFFDNTIEFSLARYFDKESREYFFKNRVAPVNNSRQVNH